MLDMQKRYACLTCILRDVYSEKVKKNNLKIVKIFFETFWKASKWLPKRHLDTLENKPVLEYSSSDKKKRIFSGRSHHGGGYTHPKIVSKNIQDHLKIKTPWHMATGNNFLDDFGLVLEGFGKQYSLLTNSLHMRLSIVASLQLLKDVLSVLPVFGYRKRFVLASSRFNFKDLFIRSLNVYLRGQRTA